MSDFLQDTLRGLSASPKYLLSKYFYDEVGDEIFREIMACPEYYLTRCEMDIFCHQSKDLADSILSHFHEFDLVELGPGDATKSVYLLDELQKKGGRFTYYPVDISENVIAQLSENLPKLLPGIDVHGLNGDYFKMLDVLSHTSGRNKVVLFLGSNIGNVPIDQNVNFFSSLKSSLSPGDIVLTGFDLVKDPEIIKAAYNDKGGITKRFNLNLLLRMNKTLGANFDLSQFAHAPVYDEKTGACKSYLESLSDQAVHFNGNEISFAKNEMIFMEISQKYTIEQTDEIAKAAGYKVLHHFFDSKDWFLDALWQVPAEEDQQIP